MMSNRVVWMVVALLALVVTLMLVLSTEQGGAAVEYAWTRIRGGYSVDERLQMHGRDVQERAAPLFAAAGVAWPPRRLALLAFKEQKRLEVYARDSDSQPWKRIAGYPILGMSGRLGPKLREGDFQVPEGLYRAEFLNANSQFHLSIRLNYPNAFDRERAVLDGRDNLGSDIMIHGSTASIGCLAMGNQVAEDLFIMAALAGRANVSILIAPTDFRRPRAVANVAGPPWLGDLYGQLALALRDFPATSLTN